MEYEIRPVTLDNVPAVLELLNTVEAAESGSSDWTPELLREHLTEPSVDLDRDGFVAWAGDLPIAFGSVLDKNRTGQVDAEHYVRPGEEHWPAGQAILNKMVARASEMAVASAHSQVRLSMGQMVAAPFANAVLPAAGWHVARQFARMGRALSAADSAPVQLPAGAAMRIVSGETDQRSFHRIATESFSEHWGSESESYDSFIERVHNRDTNDFSLWWLATVDGEDVGCLRARPWADETAFIDTVGVLKHARGSGLGSALLKVSFAEFASRATPRIELMVDTHNVTSALRVYEAVGMTLMWQADIWERTVPAT